MGSPCSHHPNTERKSLPDAPPSYSQTTTTAGAEKNAEVAAETEIGKEPPQTISVADSDPQTVDTPPNSDATARNATITTDEVPQSDGIQQQQQQKIKLFVSYSWSHRKEEVQNIARYLMSQKDFDVWLDIDKMTGGNIDVQMEEGIKEADVVVVFFCEAYSRKGTNTRKELDFACTKRKTILLVQMQKDYKPDDYLLFQVGNNLYVNYDKTVDTNVGGKEICEQIYKLLNSGNIAKSVNTAQQPLSNHHIFEHYKVPKVDDYYNRPEEELKVYTVLVEICNQPGQGVVVITGECGVGKTILLSKLLRSGVDVAGEGGPKLEKNVIVLWMDCDKWKGDSFSDADKSAFDRELVELATVCEPSFDAPLLARIVPFFESRGKRVLFVFNHMFNRSLLEHFVSSQIDGDKVSCCVITRNSFCHRWLSGDISGTVQVKVKLQLDAMSDDGIRVLLKADNERLSPDQLTKLVKYCEGLPQIASLLRSRFNNWQDDDPNTIQHKFNELFEVRPLGSAHPNRAERQIEKVMYKMFEFNIGQLPEELRACYYAFLFFEPDESVSVKDLSVFWGSSTETVVDQLKAVSLVRFFEPPASSKEIFLSIRRMMYEAALQKAVNEFQIQQNASSTLEQIRAKIVTGQVVVGSKEMAMFAAVRQQRLSLCQRFVQVIDAQSLVTVCQEHSVQQEDETQSSFLHFLYHKTWPGKDITYPKQHALHCDGVNNSYRLIVAILLKVKRDSSSIQPSKMLELINCKPRNQQSWKTLLDDVLDEKQEESQRAERNPLLSFCERWASVHEQSRWIHDGAKSNKNPLVPLIVECKEADVLSELSKFKIEIGEPPSVDKLNSVTPLVEEAALSAARIGNQNVLAEICRLFGDAILSVRGQHGTSPVIEAAKNGFKEVVTFITKKDKTVIAQADDDGCTAAIWAASNGYYDIVLHIADMDGGALLVAKNDGTTAIIAAAGNGHLDIVELIDSRQPEAIKAKTNERGDTAITVAAQHGHREVVGFIARKDKISVAYKRNDHRTAMMLAAKDGHLDIVQLIADIDDSTFSKATPEGVTATMLAAKNGHLEVVKFIIEKSSSGITEADSSGRTVIMYAAIKGRLNVVQFLVEKNQAAILQAAKNGETAIILAAQYGHLDVVTFIASVDMETVSQARLDDKTAIMMAAENSHIEVVRWLDGRRFR